MAGSVLRAQRRIHDVPRISNLATVGRRCRNEYWDRHDHKIVGYFQPAYKLGGSGHGEKGPLAEADRCFTMCILNRRLLLGQIAELVVSCTFPELERKEDARTPNRRHVRVQSEKE